MKEIIKRQTSILNNQTKTRKYQFTHEGIIRFASVKPRAQQLMITLLECIGYNTDINAVIIQKTYKDLGFNSFANFQKYRDELVNADLLFFDKKEYYVNPVHINYYTRRQKDHFFSLFNLKKQQKVVMSIPTLVKVS